MDFQRIFLLLLLPATLFAQSPSPLTSYPIGNSGCAILLPSVPDPVTMSYSPDSSKVYTIECIDSSLGKYYHFGTVVVKLKEAWGPGEEYELITGYMDYLKTTFSVDSAKGYGTTGPLASRPEAVGVSDRWIDSDGDCWRVVGWAKPDMLFVMFVYGPKEYPDEEYLKKFFQGAAFPK